MKTSELKGAALDWAVAKAEGKRPSLFVFEKTGALAAEHRYSANWAQAGPIIEREITKLFRNVGGTFTAQIRHDGIDEVTGRTIVLGWTTEAGPTALIAAMRCYVASKLGDEVGLPEGLTR